MPEYHAVQCFQCDTFQVQQVKKVNIFTCSLCGSKQSVRKVYAISGKAKDVREVVQGLNQKRAAAGCQTDDIGLEASTSAPLLTNAALPSARWEEFEEVELPGEQSTRFEDHLGQDQYVTELPEKAAAKRSRTAVEGRGKEQSIRPGQGAHGKRRVQPPTTHSSASRYLSSRTPMRQTPALASRPITLPSSLPASCSGDDADCTFPQKARQSLQNPISTQGTTANLERAAAAQVPAANKVSSANRWGNFMPDEDCLPNVDSSCTFRTATESRHGASTWAGAQRTEDNAWQAKRVGYNEAPPIFSAVGYASRNALGRVQHWSQGNEVQDEPEFLFTTCL